MSDTDDLVDNARVTLMTIHSAKGLEFPLVFVVGLEEGLFPHARVVDDAEELEEERRLFYVAITRARHQLYLTQAQRRRVYGEERITDPSRFLEEVPEQIVQFDGALPSSGGITRSPLSYGASYGAPAGPSAAKPSVEPARSQPATGTAEGFRLGDRVEHATYGAGQVVRVADGKLDIAFPGKGIKRFVAAAAPDPAAPALSRASGAGVNPAGCG